MDDELIVEYFMGRSMKNHFKNILGPWKDFGKLLKGELKRTVINMNTLLQLTLGPTLAGADYADVMKKNKEKISKIDADAEAILEKLPPGPVGTGIMFALAPGPMLFDSAREVSKKVTPEAIDKFMDEYGFKDLSIGRIPVGRMFTSMAKKGAAVGSFATLNRQGYEKSMEELEQDAEPKWYTPIERILLLQDPRGPKSRRESLGRTGALILEEDENDDDISTSDERKAFLDYLKISGFESQYMQEVSIPYVEAKDELITGLIDVFEQQIEETASISSALTFKEFIEAINSTKLEKFKQLNGQNILKDMEAEVASLIEDEKNLTKFLKAAGKTTADFEGKENELKDFLAQKIYEKEFGEVRMKSIESIAEAVEEIKVEILGDIEEKNLDDLRINPLGEQLYNSIKSGLERLDSATKSLEKMAQDAQNIGG